MKVSVVSTARWTAAFAPRNRTAPMRTFETASRESSLAPLPFPGRGLLVGGCQDSTDDDRMTEADCQGSHGPFGSESTYAPYEPDQ
jgi:hypothetical protein